MKIRTEAIDLRVLIDIHFAQLQNQFAVKNDWEKQEIPELRFPDNLRELMTRKFEEAIERRAHPVGSFLKDGVVAKSAWISMGSRAVDGVRYHYVNVMNWPIELVSQLIEAINRGLPTTEARVGVLEELLSQLPEDGYALPVDIFPSAAQPRISRTVEVPKSFKSIREDFEREFGRLTLFMQTAENAIFDTLVAQGGLTTFRGRTLYPLTETELTTALDAEREILSQLEALIEAFVSENYGKTDRETLTQVLEEHIDAAYKSRKISDSDAMKLTRRLYLTLNANERSSRSHKQ